MSRFAGYHLKKAASARRSLAMWGNRTEGHGVDWASVDRTMNGPVVDDRSPDLRAAARFDDVKFARSRGDGS